MTYQIMTLIGLAFISLSVFIIVSVLAWRDNVLLFKYFKLRSRQLLERWRDWRRAVRDPGYRQWRDTVNRYEGPANMLLALMEGERLNLALEREAENERDRNRHRREYEKFRDAKIQAVPYVALCLSEFVADDLLIVAKHLAGFDYDHPPSADDWCGPLNELIELLNVQNRVLKRNPARVVDELEILQNFCSAHAIGKA